MAFNSEALERGIEQCKKNIVTFEEAIEKERATIKEYRRQIDHNEEQERLNKIKKSHIEIIREND